MEGLTEEQAAVYDRQLRVWGVEAQRRMGASSFFVAGLTGLAAEACKNIVLAGVGVVTLLDDGTPGAEASPGNFLAASALADDPDATAAEATARTLREMNPFGRVEIHRSAGGGGFAGVTADAVAGADAVLVCGAPLAELERINDLARAQNCAFFAGECGSRSARFFVDLGDAFEYAPPKASADASSRANKTIPAAPRVARFVTYARATTIPWSSLGIDREGGIRRVNKLAGAWLLAAAFERREGRKPTEGDLDAMLERVGDEERANGVKAGWLPATAVAELVGDGVSEMPAAAAICGGVLGQEMLRAVTKVGEPVTNAFVYGVGNGQGTVENLNPHDGDYGLTQL